MTVLNMNRPHAGWADKLMRDGRGIPIANVANAITALRTAPSLAGLLSYDEMERRNLICRPVPGAAHRPEPYPRPIDDLDATALQDWLQKHELRRLSIDTTHQAINTAARDNSIHPVRDYLDGLVWDGVPRLTEWLATYLGAESNDYTRGIGRLFIIAMVARIMLPGCKADYMLVLEGAQGIGKSGACAILAGAWFSDSMPALTHGDEVRLSMHLRGKWLVEIAELSSISKAEAGALKAFLTQTKERYLPKYGRIQIEEPRQCLFIGTTNQSTYLRDETGGRRFWPVKAGAIDLAKLAADRDQLFAEAVQEYIDGKDWWPPSDFEAKHIRSQQEDRFEADPWEQDIAKHLAAIQAVKDKDSPLYTATTTIADIAKDGLYMNAARIGRGDCLRITGVLERLGWQRGTRTKTGRPWFIKRLEVCDIPEKVTE
jgi:predicted P-loop ATPase